MITTTRHNLLRVLAGVLAVLSVLLAPATVASGHAAAIPIDPPTDPCERRVPPPSCGSGSPVGTLDAVSRGPAGITVSGAATDPDAAGGVTVSITVDSVEVGTLTSTAGTYSGTLVPRAGHQVCALAINRNDGDDSILGCRHIAIAVDPIGHVDDVRSVPGGIRVRGWALDPDTTAPLQIRLIVDGSLRQTTTAAAPRPDVAAAYPGYGAMHGFDVLLGGTGRHTTVCALAVNVSPGTAESNLGCGREPLAISVLDLNLRGVHDLWDSDDGTGMVTIPWQERYDRLARWMSISGTVPDVIALQEVWASKTWIFPFPHNDPANYETLLTLINSIKARTGANYRIAYLDARHVPQGLKQLFAGEALIYNADRLRNTTSLVNAKAVNWSDEATVGVHMRISYPCAHSPACALLDLDGRHWMSSYTAPNGQWSAGPEAVVFESLAAPGKNVIVQNAHYPLRDPGPHPSTRRCKTCVDTVWARWLGHDMLMPPIVAGDFNGDPMIANFDTTVAEDVDFILIGNAANYPAMTSPRAVTQTLPNRVPGRPHCGSVPTVLSDHCALFAQYLPS